MSLLKNKNIVIIGGTTGIGLSASKAFVANGANVVVVGRNTDSVDEAMDHIRKYITTNYKIRSRKRLWWLIEKR